MKYTNPVVKGFYPDPSVCSAYGKYYMVCSSFQYFPGVPLFESDNLVNWRQIGYVLTRRSQVMLDRVNSSGGVFAPTIRFSNGRFYMVTTNDTTHENFYVYTDDIYSEWSEPIGVAQGGIDPSLYFEDGRAWFVSNGSDDEGVSGVVQCELDIATGRKLTPSRTIWQGSGGRYLESPHIYKINGIYYLMAAEGGTEYGHMITCARSRDIWGPFESNPSNPVLTNRNKAPEIIQGIGHGDLIQAADKSWHILSLGFRQIHLWMPYHNLGREVFLTPVTFHEDGWFTAGRDGTTDASYEISGDFAQEELAVCTFANTDPAVDWCWLRHPELSNYTFSAEKYILRGCAITLDDVDSPTFFGLRQRDFCFELSVRVSVDAGEAGVTAYMCESEHYDVAVRRAAGSCTEPGSDVGSGSEADSRFEVVLRLNIGGIRHEQAVVPINCADAVPTAGTTTARTDHADTVPTGTTAAPADRADAVLLIRADHFQYNFFVRIGDSETYLGCGQSKYLSSEVSGGFTGTMLALYAVGRNTAEFTEFSLAYRQP
ncbi:MAG: glycoside hydrolase family 43 protein [Lachnospiraceae bacterium]|nr:glycoside hydrolase family 43 protein [Lachnospiraceae bacterium]